MDRRLADQLEQSLDVDTDDTDRLFPTAYPDDPELDAGYQILAREQLIDSRREAIELMRTSADSDVVYRANWRHGWGSSTTSGSCSAPGST